MTSGGSAAGSADARAALAERWLDLTRRVLPRMAPAQGWPISLDHCFMRVCLDEVLGAPWTEILPRPAIRTMSEAQLVSAVRVAEAIVACPEALPMLNARSLRRRRAARARARGDQIV